MGLSSKQVINTDGLDWSRTLLQQSHDQSLLELHHRSKPPSTMRRQQHQNQQQSEPLKCPRCDSNNTKFCYYNNYNKSQPRHFCRACKRHWTKGGTLRNVPVGGGRKNKRPNKKSSSAAAVAAASAATASTAAASTAKSDAISTDSRLINSMFQPIRNKNISILPNNLALNIGDLHDEKSVSEILSQAVLIRPQSLNLIGTDNMENKSLINTNTSNTSASASTKSFFGNSSLQANFPPNQGLQCFQAFSSSTSSPFESSLSSISNSFQTSNVVCDYGEDQFKIMAEATVTSSCTVQPPWQVPSAAATAVSNGMDLPSYWNWEDIDTLVSADHINLPWDDSHDDLIKP